MNGPGIVAIVGATGTGKSDLAVGLAEALARQGRRAEIIGADAMQLYRGMDIGTAKLSVAARRDIPHHMVDVLEPSEDASVADYQREARRHVTEIHERGAVAIVVGGSGLYVNAVLYDLQFPGSDPKLRAALNARLETDGPEPLIHELLEHDPAARDTVDLANPRRVIRALEVLHLTGKPMTSQLPEQPTPVWPIRLIGVHEAREVLVERLDARVREMWQNGIVAEAEALIPRGIERSPTASRAIGYAQALAQLRGLQTEDEAIAETQFLTRRYARRQVSWFKRLPEITWVTSTDSQDPGVRQQLAEEIARDL